MWGLGCCHSHPHHAVMCLPPCLGQILSLMLCLPPASSGPPHRTNPCLVSLLPLALGAPVPLSLAPDKSGRFSERTCCFPAQPMPLCPASSLPGDQNGECGRGPDAAPCAAGHHQSSPQPVRAARSYPGAVSSDTTGIGQISFCAVAGEAV